MKIEALLLWGAVGVSVALLLGAVVVLRRQTGLRTRLVTLFVTLALVPALSTMALLWHELQPAAWRRASRGIGLSMESALVLARRVVAHQHQLAEDAAGEALARLQRRGAIDAADLQRLARERYAAYFARGEPGHETVAAAFGPFASETIVPLVRDVLPARRTGSSRAQLVVAPDSTQVVVGVAGPWVDPSGDPVHAVVVLPLAPEEAQAIAAIVESTQRSRQLGLLERLHLRHTGIFLAGLGATFLVGAVALGVVLARSMTRPIDRLQGAFEVVASGEFGHQVHPEPPGELGRLTRAFNRMSHQLQRSHEQLLAATQRAAWQGVARRLAHEIKNPLTPIRLSIHRIRRHAEPHAVVADCLQTIDEEAAHLERLANEFSAFARLPKPRLETVDPAEVLHQVLELHRAHPGLQIRAQMDGIPTVRADRDQLRQVFTNVVKNAIEAMPQGGRLEVQWNADATGVEVTFLDEGGGFPERGNVFEPTFTTKETGSGLGLAIVRRILDDHGGDVEAGNRPRGGAWVRIRLPRAGADTEPPRPEAS